MTWIVKHARDILDQSNYFMLSVHEMRDGSVVSVRPHVLSTKRLHECEMWDYDGNV